MKYISIAALVIGGMVAGTSVSAPLDDETKKIKQMVSEVCNACHGMDGNGAKPVNPEFPKIAGKQAVYLIKQLKDFQSGKRKSDIMAAMSANLSPDDISNLAIYFAEQKVKPGKVTNSGLIARGKKYYEEGDNEVGVPACSGCHLPDGSGNTKYPHLAGQHAAYTYQQLKLFASGARENDRGLVMQSLSMRMSEQDMKAVSEYIMSMQ